MAGDPEQETAYRAGDLRLFESGLFSDVVVECGPRSWNLHRNILCTRSVWFETALTGSYVTAQMRSQQEAFDGVIRIHEQDPEAVEVCLKYIYGGVAAIDMATETRFRPAFKFCAELYRSADFFLLKPLLPVVQRHLGDYCDEKTKWIWTRGNMIEDERNEKKALVWIEDLKAAILETSKWNTPVINIMLMEFVWVSRTANVYPTYISIGYWLHENARGFQDTMKNRCITVKPTMWWPGRKPSPPVWTPPGCTTPMTAVTKRPVCDTCVRCYNKLELGDCNEKGYGQLQDPFNPPHCSGHLREWCRECVAETKYPWREDGYL